MTRARRTQRHRSDDGGIWVRTGWILGILFYLLMLVMYRAGFHVILPFIVIPPALAVMIAGNSLLGGPRRRENELEPLPVSAMDPLPPVPDPDAGTDGGTGEPPGADGPPAPDGSGAATANGTDARS